VFISKPHGELPRLLADAQALGLGPSLEGHGAADVDDHPRVLVARGAAYPPRRELRRLDRLFAAVLAFVLVDVGLC
jgi:hypothetical protein